MGGMSRNKGKRGEREIAAWLTERGFPATRGAQHRGGPGSPDVLCEGLPGVHIEVKRNEGLRLYDALKQAIDEAGVGEFGAVFHRRNGKRWVVIMDAEDWLEIVTREEGLK